MQPGTTPTYELHWIPIHGRIISEEYMLLERIDEVCVASILILQATQQSSGSAWFCYKFLSDQF